MFNYDYSICDLQIQMQTQQKLTLGDESQLFAASPAPPDVCISLSGVDAVPVPSGAACNSSREQPVYRSGSQISRCSWDFFRPQTHFRTDYSLEAPNQLRCLVRNEYWTWATRGKYLWPGIALNTLLLHNRGMMLHASYIEHNGSGIIFTAPSGTGKSTQAQLWQQYRNAQILNGDKVGLRLQEVPMAHGVPFSGTSGICQNVSLPLKAIVVLSQAPVNSVCRLSPSKAIEALFPNLFVDRSIAEEWQLGLHLLLELVSSVPVLFLACTPDEKAVETLEQALAAF